MSEDLTEKLKAEIKEANWDMLVDHHSKENVIWISQDLDLVNVGLTIAEDDTLKVKAWMDSEKIHKPTQEQVDMWSKSPQDKNFLFLILQPYVVIQQKLN